ncbi:uncharacterized protein LOC100205192 isoform X2 [Hydra vulgaris]|uniref:Uncharacterized protein LOC100205192 isoform X2 n=1 Tax=Hydra vulgaris TaxID=6087 RepID=A0ABM4BBU5_HYDVU
MGFNSASSLLKVDNYYLKKLNVLLSPPNALGKNVAELAGRLGFTISEIDYITEKSYPFIYMLESWVRKNQNATLQVLRNEIYGMGRLDAVEVLDDAVKAIHENNIERDVGLAANQESLKRFASNTTLLSLESSQSVFSENLISNSTHDDSIRKALNKSKFDDLAPVIYVVYYPDNESHTSNVFKFVQILQEKYKINASTADDVDINKASYIDQKFNQANYVLLVCSPGLKFCFKSDENPNSILQLVANSEKSKEISFVSKLILNDIFARKNLSKYIPILLPNLCNVDSIPLVLQGATKYKFPEERNKLINRILKRENFVLPVMPKKNVSVVNTKTLFGGGLLKLSIST